MTTTPIDKIIITPLEIQPATIAADKDILFEIVVKEKMIIEEIILTEILATTIIIIIDLITRMIDPDPEIEVGHLIMIDITTTIDLGTMIDLEAETEANLEIDIEIEVRAMIEEIDHVIDLLLLILEMSMLLTPF